LLSIAISLDLAVDSEQFRRDLKTYLFAGHSKYKRVRVVYVIVLYKTNLLTYLPTSHSHICLSFL